MARAIQFLLALAFLAGFGWVIYVILQERARTGKDMPDYSLYASGPKGLASLGEQLRKLGFEPVPLSKPVYQTRNQGLLIMAEPAEEMVGVARGPTPEQAKRLLDWVAGGNTLVLWGRGEHAVHHELNVTLTLPANETVPVTAVIPYKTVYTDRVKKLQLEKSAGVKLARDVYLTLWELPEPKTPETPAVPRPPERPGRPSAQKKPGLPGAVLVPHGQGRVIVIGDPSLLTEEGRKRADNALVVVDLISAHAPDGRVMFDEYEHGFRSSSNFIGYLRRHGQMALLAQLALVTVAVGWALARRLGPAVPVRTGARADAVDYAAAMAKIYEKAGAAHWLAAGLVRNFYTALTSHLRLNRQASHQEITKAWAIRHPAARQQLEEVLNVAKSIEVPLSPSRLLSAAQAFDRFRQEFLERKLAKGRQVGRVRARVS